MTEVHIRHSGSRTLAVAVPGGMLTVKPGANIGPIEISPLSEEQRELYKSKGLFFSDKPSDGKERPKKGAGGKERPKKAAGADGQQLDLGSQGGAPDENAGADLAALQKAVEVAKAKHAEALAAAERTGGDAEKDALQAAINELEDAEDALEEASQ